MARYYGIDLGTTNTVISMLNITSKEILLQPNSGCVIESVPIYYDYCEWDEGERRFLSYFEWVDRDGILQERDLLQKMALAPRKMPSVVYRHRYGSGDSERVTMLTGQPAVEMYDKNPNPNDEDFYENTKILMDKNDMAFDPSALSAEDVAYYLLKTCFVSIMMHEKRGRKRGKVNAIGISYPAARNQKNYLECLERAANRAAREVGFLKEDAPRNFVCTTQEPYAAITNLVVNECISINDAVPGAKAPAAATPGKERFMSMMVVDIGGGTTDIAVQPIHFLSMPNNKAHLPLYPEGYEIEDEGDPRTVRSAVTLRGDFGGADIDAMLACKIARNAYGSIGVQPNMNALPPYVLNKALTAAREVKHFFSDNPKAEKYEKLLPDFFASNDRVHRYTLSMTRGEYEQWITPYIYNTEGYRDPYGDYKRMEDGKIYSIETLMNDTRKHANCLSWNDVDCVFVTGGMSKMPQIREMIESTVMGTSCKVVYSDDFRELDRIEIENRTDMRSDANSMRFFDIAYGVAVYTCLNEKHQEENDDFVPGTQNKYKYKDFVPSPHSSIALLADLGEGKLPVELIGHSQSLPVKDAIKPDVFTSRNVFNITVQLYTGLSPYDPYLRTYEKCKVPINQYPPMPGTKISLMYNIDQDMQAALSLKYVDAQGEPRTVPMREINLDAVESADS